MRFEVYIMDTVLNDSDLVLEIGSGSSPWKRSDVLLDRFYIDKTGQRGKGSLFTDDRPMIVAAGERLPFKDKSFDYIYCNHVIEHAEDLETMLSEMSRVGKAGFIECPNPLLERVLDEAHHNWYVSNVNNILIASRKTAINNVTTDHDRFYFQMMSHHFIIRNYWKYFVTRLEWKNEIKYEIYDEVNIVFHKHVIDVNIDNIVQGHVEKVLRKAWKDAFKEKLKKKIKMVPFSNGLIGLYRKLRKKMASSRKIRVNNHRLGQILVCPYCHGEIKKLESSYDCSECEREYRIKSDIPVFL